MPRLTAQSTPATSAVNRLLVVDYTLLTSPVSATGTVEIVTWDGDVVSSTLTVGDKTYMEGVAYTAETSNEVTAANLAAAITGDLPTDLVSAVAVGAVITLTAAPGASGNMALSSNAGLAMTLSGANLSGGEDPGDTVEFDAVNFTPGIDFTAETSNDITAGNIATAINGALPDGIASASAAGSVVTVTATSGAAGNALTLSSGYESGAFQLVPGPIEFSGGADLTATPRSSASGRSAASNRRAVFNFPNSLMFDAASNEYGSVAAPADILVTSRTIELWAMFRTLPTSTQPFFGLGSSNYYFGFTLNSMIASYADSGAVQRTAFSNNLQWRRNSWDHYAITVSTVGNDVTRTFYKNGVQFGTATNSTGHGTSYGATLYMGVFTPGSLNLDAYIANVGFYGRALDASEILRRARNLPVTSGQLHRWLFSEGSGATVADSVGSTNLALTNTPTWLSGVVPMKSRTAVS